MVSSRARAGFGQLGADRSRSGSRRSWSIQGHRQSRGTPPPTTSVKCASGRGSRPGASAMTTRPSRGRFPAAPEAHWVAARRAAVSPVIDDRATSSTGVVVDAGHRCPVAVAPVSSRARVDSPGAAVGAEHPDTRGPREGRDREPVGHVGLGDITLGTARSEALSRGLDGRRRWCVHRVGSTSAPRVGDFGHADPPRTVTSLLLAQPSLRLVGSQGRCQKISPVASHLEKAYTLVHAVSGVGRAARDEPLR